MRLGQSLAVVGVAWSMLAVARPAKAATEARFGGDDVRVTVDEAGSARVEHALSYRVSGTPPKGFDLTGIEAEAVLDPEAPVALDGETTNAARVERKGDRALRITLNAPPRRIAGHAILVVRVSYTVDLVQARELTLDGAMWRLTWAAPVAPEGFDGARATFDLPAAPTEPRAAAVDGTDDGRTVTLRREVQRDELAMERPHVARGEAATWILRVDPHAFPRVVDPSLRPPVASAAEATPAPRIGAWLAAVVVGLVFAALARTKWGRFSRASAKRGVEARALIGNVPPALRAVLAGGAIAAGVAFEAANRPTWGGVGIALAMFLVAARMPERSSPPRGPGQWLALSPGEAFAPEREGDLLDAATWSGKAALVVTALGAVALGVALRPIDGSWMWLVPLDALALLPLFVTGSRAQLPPDRAISPKRRLSSIHRVLKRDGSLRVSPWARVPLGASVPDELRLLVLPRAAMPGVVGIEVGVAWIATAAGYASETEVLVRVRDATAAAARMVTLGPHRRPVPGRKTEERVVRLVPALPSRGGAVALVRRLAEELRDRRKSVPGVKWPGAERRLPPNERLRAPVSAAA